MLERGGGAEQQDEKKLNYLVMLIDNTVKHSGTEHCPCINSSEIFTESGSKIFDPTGFPSRPSCGPKLTLRSASLVVS